jgi:hypothetical protein
MSLLIIGLCRWKMTPEAFKDWGWRIPPVDHPAVFSVYIRLKLNESPDPAHEGRAGDRGAAWDAFTNWKNLKIVLLSSSGRRRRKASSGIGVFLRALPDDQLRRLSDPTS